VEGRDTEAVFTGEGEFAFQPLMSTDQSYMQSLTGQPNADETFDRALLVFTDKTGEEIRAAAQPAASADSKLADALKEFRKRLRFRPEVERSMADALVHSDTMDNLDADILADVYNPAQPGFFAAYIHGRKHSDLRFLVKPRGVLPELPAPEEVALINLDPEAPQDGIWVLEHLKAELDVKHASSAEDKRVIAAKSYDIETTIGRNDHFTGTARLKFQAVGAGDRLIRFGLAPSLRVTNAKADGKEIAWVQEDRREDGTFYAIMPAGMARGSEHELVIDYLGDRVVRKEGGGNFSVGARESWYPSVNSFRDHVQFHLVFRVPKQYVLVSVGKLTRQWTEGDFACTDWQSEAPMAVAGFNFGSFQKKEVTDADTKIVVQGYATSEVPDYLRGAENVAGVGTLTPTRLLDTALSESQNALRIYNAWFGKSEFSRIAITQQPEDNFGQSWPELVYLPLISFLDSTQRWRLLGGNQTRVNEFIDEVTPHEVSHQWWGHMVGWRTFHDQWLSEGFAEWSAGLYLQLTEKNKDKYAAYWDHARHAVVDKNTYGNRPNDAGPIWMGLRLVSTRNASAYNAVVYRKGGYILHMLRALMYDAKEGDKPFMDMMRDFVQTHMNDSATSESFQRVVEKHIRPVMNLTGDGRLDWFFREWVYGTDLPKYKFDYTIEPKDGKFLLNGRLTQSEVSANFAMLIPLYAEFDNVGLARIGLITAIGNQSGDVKVLLPQKPKRVLINAMHDVLEQ
jgi:hypothetical protein